MTVDKKNLIPFLVGIGILFPLFFTLSGGVYRYPGTLYDSGGVITTLPLPISILVCLIALLLLFPRLREAKLAWTMIAGTLVALIISLWLGSDGVTSPNRKLVMIVQVVLPLIGLLLGQLIQDMNPDGKTVARSFLIVLSVVVPLQLYMPLINSPWLNPGELLADHLYLFTIYSHIQYVTLIFVCAFAYALGSLWDEHKVWLSLLAIVLVLYVLRSSSYLTMVAFGIVVLAFSSWRLICHGKNLKVMLTAAFVAVATLVGVLTLLGKEGGQASFVTRSIGAAQGKIQPLLEGKIPSNVQERFGDWERFGNGIIETNKTTLVGHPQPMPREIRTSPHNWYIDIAYTFGLIALLPMFSLIAYTVNLCFRQRKYISTQTWWLAGIVFYLVVIDSNFKVTLRQPYPGIFAFFIWGMLLTRLSTLKMVRAA